MDKNDYLITVSPNALSGKDVESHRLIDKTEEFKEGYMAALKQQYADYSKYRIIIEKF